MIVVDGGSSDDGAARAATLADRILSAPRGRAVQMNAGAVTARGKILLFLHADCALPRDADRLILDGITAHNRRWGRFDVRLAGTHPLLRVIAFMMNWRSRLTGIATGDQGMFVARNLERIADHTTNIAEDVIFLVRGIDIRHHVAQEKLLN